MNVIGLDLSLNGTGICVDDRRGYTIAGKAVAGDMRLVTIRDSIYYSIAATEPRLAVIEGLPFGNNDRAVALVHGTAREVLARAGVPYAYVYPTTLKMFATEKATAYKGLMMYRATEAGAPADIDDNQADAFWLRRMGLAAIGESPASLTAEQVEILGKVEWPLSVVTPYGAISERKVVRKKCGHKMIALKNGDHWIHPFNVVRCEKPPK